LCEAAYESSAKKKDIDTRGGAGEGGPEKAVPGKRPPIAVLSGRIHYMKGLPMAPPFCAIPTGISSRHRE
jgi:hypothetical protein